MQRPPQVGRPSFDRVFVPGGIPALTYNPRQELHLEERLNALNGVLHKFAVMTGDTKSGKTVLAKKMLPDAIWVDGGYVRSEDDFWHFVNSHLDLYPTTQHETTSQKSATIRGDASAAAHFIIAKGSGTISAGHTTTRNSGVVTS